MCYLLFLDINPATAVTYESRGFVVGISKSIGVIFGTVDAIIFAAVGDYSARVVVVGTVGVTKSSEMS